MNKENAKEILLEVKSILDKNDIEFFLIWGVLLGVIRGNDFIDFDFDIDLGIKHSILVSKIKDLEKQFIDAGFIVKLCSTPYQYDRFLKVFKKDITVDIVDFNLRGDEYFHAFKFNRGCFVFPRKYFDTLDELEFLGETFKVPHNPKEYLEYVYTVSWNVEDKNWNWETTPSLRWGYFDFAKMFNLVNPLHISCGRDYKSRMDNDKVSSMKIARQFGYDFWDGDRKYGYGGYKDDGRWRQIADKMIKIYGLTPDSKVLDIGCGKGFLGKCLEKLCGCKVVGADISDYALENCVLSNKLKFEAGKDELTEDYDLIISINTLHNLILPNLKQAIEQINKHSKNAYILVESYRSEQELYNLQCWALTCEQFLRPEEWTFIFREWGYLGDYEFIFFE